MNFQGEFTGRKKEIYREPPATTATTARRRKEVNMADQSIDEAKFFEMALTMTRGGDE